MSSFRPVLRRASHKETRNGHQVAIAERFSERDGIFVAMEENDLPDRLDELLARVACDPIPSDASPRLIDALRTFIRE
ncbi:MAG: hypothetical protein QGG14_08085 [Planctomycetota bacterium]|jgi:hypothetical protein|nr:hypothetical protein [Planctomycetota bacterium]